MTFLWFIGVLQQHSLVAVLGHFNDGILSDVHQVEFSLAEFRINFVKFRIINHDMLIGLFMVGNCKNITTPIKPLILSNESYTVKTRNTYMFYFETLVF